MRILVYIFLCLVWGSTWMAIKIGLQTAPPLYAAGIRFVLAVAILLSIVAIMRLRLPRGVEFWRVGYPGVYMYGLSYALIYVAEWHITSALTSVLFASFPMFVAILSIWMLRVEHLRPIGWLGLIAGFSGIVTLSYASLQGAEFQFAGTMLALAGSFAAAYGMLLHKKRFAGLHPVVTVTVQMLVGGLPLLPLAVLVEDVSKLHLFMPETLGSILYLAVFGSVLAFLGYYWLLSKTGAITVSLIAFVTPVTAVLIGVVGFREPFSLLTVVGTSMVLAGVLLVTIGQVTVRQHLNKKA